MTHQTREAQNLPFHPLGLGGLKGALYPWASLNSLLLDARMGAEIWGLLLDLEALLEGYKMETYS